MKSDSQLQQDVSEELQWEPAVHAARIGVSATGGVVTLAGQVDSYDEKWHAERAAQRVAGVKALTSELTVQLPGMVERTDADIARSVENVLEWTASLPGNTVKVLVEHGQVTLSGQVGWQFQRQAAADGVRHLMGVTGLDNKISLEPSISMTAVKADIEAALKRTAIADARNISVEVHGADVTLGGTVRSWAERETATGSAWKTPGVRNVFDNLQMVW